MGNDDIRLSRAETAVLLGISLRQLSRLVRNEELVPVYREGRSHEPEFRKSEVLALVAARREKLSPRALRATALQAKALAENVSARLDQLLAFWDAEREHLPTEITDVQRFYQRAQQLLDDPSPKVESSGVMRWARTLHAINEAFLRLVADATGSKEPWRVFLEVSDKLLVILSEGPSAKYPAFQEAFAYVNQARDQLYKVSYFCARARYGARIASELFSEGDLDGQILGHIQENQRTAEADQPW